MKLRVYQFMKANHGLSAITNRRLKVSRIHELNDPFEFLGVELADRQFRQVLKQTKAQLSKNNGLLCFSGSWKSPVQWAHYANRHSGLCLGFDVPRSSIGEVTYVDSRLPKPQELTEEFMKKLLFSKFSHWFYEDEYRAYVSIDTPIDGLYYMDFSDDLVLKQVFVGAESSVTREQLRKALGRLGNEVESFKVRPAFQSFQMVKQKREELWP